MIRCLQLKVSKNCASNLYYQWIIIEINIKNLDMCASIKIDKSIPPVQQSYRRIPIPLEELTLLKLKELEKQDIIERVRDASEWVSPMIVKRKSSTEVRIIIDLREANKAIIREIHPLPTLEQMACQLRGSKVFSKFDIKQAFHQLMLREDCRYITTFISPLGLMRYKRLVLVYQRHLNFFKSVWRQYWENSHG